MFRTIKSKFVTITVLFILLSVGIPTTFLIYQFRENFKERSYIMVETTIDVILNCINPVSYTHLTLPTKRIV